MTRRPWLAATAAAGLLAACSPDPEETAIPPEDYPAATQTGEPAAPSPATTMAFVDQMAASNLYGIEAGELAGQMGTSQEVKTFAATMVKEHTAAAARLKEVAEDAQPASLAAPALTEDQRLALDALRKAGLDFNGEYARTQVTAHEEALRALRGYAAAGENAALRDYAAEAIPAVERHLEQAKRLPGAMPPVKVPPRPLANRRNSG